MSASSNRPQQLIERLNAIGDSLRQTGKAFALLGLGSVGVERDRLDDQSDLDFFAIVKPGYKAEFIRDLSWLTNIAPAAYYFQNTLDGYKFLYADGIFCEYAVFEPDELANIPFAGGAVVWKADDFDESILSPYKRTPGALESTVDWQLGEALTNLYIGLMRLERGEILSAQRFIQHYAVDRTLHLASKVEPRAQAHADPFAVERRIEQLYPSLAPILPNFVQGYSRNRESARAILEYLDSRFDVNPEMKSRILELCKFQR